MKHWKIQRKKFIVQGDAKIQNLIQQKNNLFYTAITKKPINLNSKLFQQNMELFLRDFVSFSYHFSINENTGECFSYCILKVSCNSVVIALHLN